jgi:hypothetical protein
LEPLTIITTIQPVLVLWIVAIAFFVTLAIIAILSKGRRWYELACLFFLCFMVICAAGLFGTHLVLDIQLLELEVISLR